MKPLPKLVQIAPNLPAPPRTGGFNRKAKEWQSMGVRSKPESCGLCQMSQIGTAFVPDHMPATAKIVFVFPFPHQSDAADQRPLSGSWGDLMKKLLITDLGRSVDEVGLVNGIRCMPKKIVTRQGPDYVYPTGAVQRSAESSCRQYDSSSFRDGLLAPGGVIEFNPNLMMATLDLSSILEVGAFKFMIQEDVKKSFTFVDEGYRVALLFGSEALSLVAGHLKGGAKRWRGSFWESSGWPFESKVRKEGFR